MRLFKEIFGEEKELIYLNSNDFEGEKLNKGKNEIFIIQGSQWKDIAKGLDVAGYVAWEDYVPEWIFYVFKSKTGFGFREIVDMTQFNESEMGDFFDFISKYKPLAAVFGNCQSIFISRLLQNTDPISKEYVFCEFPFVQDMKIEAEQGFSTNYMKFFRLFIYQNVSEKNNYGRKLATEQYVLKTLDKNCIKVSIPFVYFKGYFPQYIKNTRNGLDDICPYGDIKIQEFCEKGLSKAEIMAMAESDTFFSEEEIKKNLQETTNELKIREERCDIKILDFILENYQRKYLFYTPSHPTKECLKELVRRILNYLGYADVAVNASRVRENDIIKMCIYPAVCHKLQLSFEIDRFRFHINYGGRDSGGGYDDTLQEYIEKYIEYNYPEFCENSSQFYRVKDIRYILNLDDKLVSERLKGTFTISGRTLHLCLYLNVESEILSGTIITIKERYAPRYVHITCLHVVPSGQVAPLFLNSKGEFVVKSQFRKGSVLILDTSWEI